MFAVQLLGFVMLGVLSSRIPVPTFIFSAATTSPVSESPPAEDQSNQLLDDSTPLPLMKFQELFEKLLSADIIHFQTTTTTRSLVGNEVNGGIERQTEKGDIREIKQKPDDDKTNNFPPQKAMSPEPYHDDPSMLTFFLTSGGVSLLISLLALTMATGMLIHEVLVRYSR